MKTLFRITAALMMVIFLSACGGGSSGDAAVAPPPAPTEKTYYADADGDGYGDPAVSLEALTKPTGYVLDGTDCDDADPSANPGAAEVCDNVDNDCNAATVDGVSEAWSGAACDGTDSDLCLEGTFSCVGGTQTCGDTTGDLFDICDGLDNDCNPATADGAGESWLGQACDGDDLDACLEGNYLCAGGTQICDDTSADNIEICDGEDNDCNGSVDDGLAFDNYYADNDLDGYGDPSSGQLLCEQPAGTVLDASDCNDGDDTVNPGAAELCDGLDQDCDGLADNGFTLNESCSVGIGACQRLGFTVCTADTTSTECNASPGAPEAEICDGLDNDCNGTPDDGLTPPSATLDQGVCAGSVQTCSGGGGWIDPDYTLIPYFEVTETTCDGLDNDCDALYDEELLTDFYPDADNDGYGDDAAGPVQMCSLEPGYSPVQGDCDDTNPFTYTGASELCDGIDNNCDGDATDVDCTEDIDNDGFTVGAGDCNDFDPTVNPGAVESCNEQDNDCNGLVDDGVGDPYYPDGDGDGHGDATATATYSCDYLPGYSQLNDDCDDSNPTVNPLSFEECDGADNDCNGVVDDGLLTFTVGIDADGDFFPTDASPLEVVCEILPGYADINAGVDCDDADIDTYPGAPQIWYDGKDQTCFASGSSDYDQDIDGYDSDLHGGTDCDDTDWMVRPDAAEECDGVDQNCDGQIDEGLICFDYYDVCGGSELPFEEFQATYTFDFGYATAQYNDPANCPAIGDNALGIDIVIPVVIPAGARMFALFDECGYTTSAYITDTCGGSSGCLAAAMSTEGEPCNFTLSYKNGTLSDTEYYLMVDQVGADPTLANVTFGACNNGLDGPQLTTIGDETLVVCALSLAADDSYGCVDLAADPAAFAACVQTCITDNSTITADCSNCYYDFSECIVTDCSSVCPPADPENQAQMDACGECVDAACSPANDFCTLGGAQCALGFEECNGGCTDLAIDELNCGSCGNYCGDGGSCVDGGCICALGSADCYPDDGVACETDLSSDDQNCGACGSPCAEVEECVDAFCVLAQPPL